MCIRDRLLHQILGFLYIHKAAGYDIRPCNDHARCCVYRHNDDQQAVLREMLAVAQHRRANVADTKAVHQQASCRLSLIHICGAAGHALFWGGYEDAERGVYLFYPDYLDGEDVYKRQSLKSAIKGDVSDYLFKKTKRSPMVLPIIMEI